MVGLVESSPRHVFCSVTDELIWLAEELLWLDSAASVHEQNKYMAGGRLHDSTIATSGVITWNLCFFRPVIFEDGLNNILFVSLPVTHHICEQAPEQAESGGDWAGISGRPTGL